MIVVETVDPLDLSDSKTGSEIHCQYGSEAIVIRRVYTPPKQRNRGGASRLIRHVCSVADSFQLRLVLYATPDPDSPYNTAQMIEFYRKFGFRLEPDLDPDELQCMIREPKTKERRN
jgi:GNAT superfamily N-acetyltransferase